MRLRNVCCVMPQSYNTYILVNFEKYFGFSGTVGCSACIPVRTISQGVHGCNEGGMVSEKLHRGASH